MKQLIALTTMLVVAGFATSTTQAATVGYWRFEGDATGFVNDSGPNDLDLTLSSPAPTQYALPTGGAGSKFDNPIPQNNLANIKAANLNGTDNYFTHADATGFTVSDFTVEAYIHRDTSTTLDAIASQFDTTSDNRSWQFVIAYDGVLFLTVSSDGYGTADSIQSIRSEVTIAAGKDYYVAISFDLSKSGTGSGGVKFYYQNLTDGGSMQTVTCDHTLTAIHNSTGNFEIGCTGGNGNHPFDGLIDEVRLSNTVLDQDDLLASTPEPATMTLLLLGLPLVLHRRRK